MDDSAPHYLLYCDIGREDQPGRWWFLLKSADGPDCFEAADTEPHARGERLHLLTIVRALESLDRPCRVTLVTLDPYVGQGIRFGLPEWRANGWQWEFFGQMVPIKHCDLWQRLDRAMQFHQVELRRHRIDGPHPVVPAPPSERVHERELPGGSPGEERLPARLRQLTTGVLDRVLSRVRRWSA